MTRRASKRKSLFMAPTEFGSVLTHRRCSYHEHSIGEGAQPERATKASDALNALSRRLAGPRGAVYDERPSPQLVRDESSTAAGVPPMPPQTKVILLVDDDMEIIDSMRAVLENKGYRILAARDGNAGLAIAERENPDLIVLDMMMPKKSGFLVLEKLKGRPGGLIPTIMITGNEGSRHRAYAEMLGVRDYIRKPFALEKLVKSIEKIFEGDPQAARKTPSD
jgi:CheY-like chemotaxis protein